MERWSFRRQVLGCVLVLGGRRGQTDLARTGVGVGATARYVTQIFGRRSEYDWQITEFEREPAT